MSDSASPIAAPDLPEESDIVLRTGATARLRHVRPEDAPAVEALHARLSSEALYFRFLGVPASTDVDKAAYLCGGGPNQVTLVAECAGRIVAIAGYYLDPSGPIARKWRSPSRTRSRDRAWERRLLERLAEIARGRGVTTFVADVHSANRRMLEVFRDCGFEAEQRLEHGLRPRRHFPRGDAAFEERAAQRSVAAASASMRRLFEPRSVAVVGAARSRGKIGSEIFHNLLAAGFRGEVHPVNPAATSIAGRRCYPTARDIPGPVDLAVLVIPSSAVESAVDDCIAKGVPALVVISAGFRETGEEGRRREAAILEKVRARASGWSGPIAWGS